LVRGHVFPAVREHELVGAHHSKVAPFR
jgi:hypothetical protein